MFTLGQTVTMKGSAGLVEWRIWTIDGQNQTCLLRRDKVGGGIEIYNEGWLPFLRLVLC